MDLPYSKALNGKRLMVTQGDSPYAFARQNDAGEKGVDKDSRIISTLTKDTFGPDGLDYADVIRASIRAGGDMGDAKNFLVALL